MSLIRTTESILPTSKKCYFEITIINPGKTGIIGIGLMKNNTESRDGVLPGWLDDSIGYHGNDGGIYHNGRSPITSSVTFTTGDTVGCLVEMVFPYIGMPYQICSFAKNGKKLNLEPIRLLNNEGLYPTIAMDSPGAAVKTNFGERDFTWHIQSKE